jgi:beta-galactosidase
MKSWRRILPIGIILTTVLVAEAASTREDIRLEGQWKFIRVDTPGAEAPGFEDGDWQRVTLPHTWNNLDGQDGGNDYYRGVGWYRRHLPADKQYAGRSLFVKFDGAATVAEVFVNGKPVGVHRGGFAAFCFEITPFLKVGQDNVIAVKVSNAPDPDVPPLAGDFTIFGGLYRGVHLLVLDKLSITPLDFASPGLYLKPLRVAPEGAEVEITSRLRNAHDAAKTTTVRCSIIDADGKCVARSSSRKDVPAHGTHDIVQTVTLAKPHLWNGRSDPYLYRVTVEVVDGDRVTDSLTQPLGLRYFQVDPDEGFSLNGKHYPLHGVNRHQDRIDKGWAIGPAEHREDADLILEMGCTAVRLAHYQQAQEFYDLCDERGLVVWAELGLIDKLGESPAFAENARQQLTELIKQNYNHPSIVFWGLSNELHFKDRLPAAEGCQLIRSLNQLAKTLDPVRLTTLADCCLPMKHPSTMITDVLGLNRYDGWYVATLEDWPATLDKPHAVMPARCIGVSEYGAGASIHQHTLHPSKPANTVSPWHPEEWQNLSHEAAWKAMKQRPWLWGTFVWNMFDFAVDQRHEGDHPGRNDKGLVTYDRQTRKDAFFWYKANWATEPFVYITSRRFTPRTDAQTPVKIYSNCEEVVLKINGVSLKPRHSDDHIFLWEDVVLQPGENLVEAIGNQNGSSFSDSCTWTYREPPQPHNAEKAESPDS